jgi:hypothetical protein
MPERYRPAASKLPPRSAALAAEKPRYEDNDENNAQNPAEPRAAVATVRVISTAAAKQEHEDYDEYDEAHDRDSRGSAPGRRPEIDLALHGNRAPADCS